MLELHPTSFNKKLSHDNMIEKCSSEHIKKKKKEKKDEKKKKKESKTRTIILNCRNVKGGWNLSICPFLNPFAHVTCVCYGVFRNQETNHLFLLQTDIYIYIYIHTHTPCRKKLPLNPTV